MRWYFVIDEYFPFDFTRVAVTTARQNVPWLEPVCLTPGLTAEQLAWLEGAEVRVVTIVDSPLQELMRRRAEELFAMYTSARLVPSKTTLDQFVRQWHVMCLKAEIPWVDRRLGQRAFAFVADADVIFLAPFGSEELPRPTYLAASYETTISAMVQDASRHNTGVMVLNTTGMAASYADFLQATQDDLLAGRLVVKERFLNLQAAYHCYYKARDLIERLGPEYNFRPFMEGRLAVEPRIVHFSGPKPDCGSESPRGYGPGYAKYQALWCSLVS